MDDNVDANAALGYAEFHLFPSESRYKVFGYSGDKAEILRSGSLDELVQHVPQLKDWSSAGLSSYFRLEPPKDVESRMWFTKSSLTRFLEVTGLPDFLSKTDVTRSEISQLEETRKFHFSLYTKGHKDHSEDAETEVGNSNIKASKSNGERQTPPVDASKNELLRAMDLRVTALKQDLIDTFNRTTGVTYSSKEIADLERIFHLFQALDMRDIMHKLEADQSLDQIVDLPDHKTSSTEHKILTSKLSNSDRPVKYGVSPAKAAQVERRISAESEESSYSSEEDDDQPSAERSRPQIRSASPRRSASPMRRIQIGRSGSRRSTALTIKSLSHFPSRDRISSNRDGSANNSEEESDQQPPPRKADSNGRRMSVQDAISLFERKQTDQSTTDNQKRRSTLDGSFGANKGVLRRWSSSMDNSTVERQPEPLPESSEEVIISETIVDQESIETAEMDPILVQDEEKKEHYPIVNKPEENTEKLRASAEWSKQKEVELNQMLMTMMESKPNKYKNTSSDKNLSSRQVVTQERKGGLYDHYKEKRDEKLRGETAGKQAEKAAQFKAMRRVLEERKAEMAVTNNKKTDSDKKPSSIKSQRPAKIPSPQPVQKIEPSKSTTAKRTSKVTPSSAVRKSWPSTPSTRAAAGVSPVKTPGGTPSASTTPTHRKPQSVPSVPRQTHKVEPTPLPNRNAKAASQTEKNKSVKAVNEKKLIKKTAKTKVHIPEKDSSIVSTSPKVTGKVTKKSSVVPVESKPFLRKGSRVIKPKTSPQTEGIRKSYDNKPEIDTIVSNSETTNQQDDSVAVSELKTQLPVQEKHDDDIMDLEEAVNSEEHIPPTPSELIAVAEVETSISPTAWIEIEDHSDEHIIIPSNDYSTSPANVAPVSINQRVRHSLSQMLQEESAESDITEWGNAENPPATIYYQRDSPKGFKRLLKFARKSRADPNLTGCSSPSPISDGEDDSEESKSSIKKNSDEYLSRNHLNEHPCHQNTIGKVLANGRRLSSQTDAQKLRRDHISAGTSSSSKAFRGGSK
ncbi:flocculation protein FLO11-like isoform X2 [Impatiens glandulifera]|uniref:flocculation protein FLO11-like isoform X2 n=1 Tax=Impatiens glandulifera TaxID=253017 RepID=UPI001FB101C4|nr:flocculation protein FLO11-like isoform X2 [Impatiens glandulifera]